MCDDYSYFRWRELHKAPVLLPIEARGKYNLIEYQVAVSQTLFFFFCLFFLTSGTLLFLIKSIHYDLPGVGERRTRI